MQKLEYQVRFTTPAFLGDAEQNGRWRTPPFKALLRQWWRVVKAKDYRYNHADIRQHEGHLFGNAWLTDSDDKPLHRKSRISIRLAHWHSGKLTSQGWPGGAMRADVYLGFGPVLPPSKKENRPSVTIRNAIGTTEESILMILPERLAKLRPLDQDMHDVRDAIQLMNWFGTVGSRSRNGWGSLAMSAKDGTPVVSDLPDEGDPLLTRIGMEWTACLKLDWPHALGYSGDKPLIWVSQPYRDWRKVMGCLANIRVEVRRVAKSFVGPGRIGGIHLLGYPAGDNWTLRQFSRGQPSREHQEARLATQLRFKVVQTAAGLRGVVFHMPHRLPDELMDRLDTKQREWLSKNELRVWTEIHNALNHSSRLRLLGDMK